MPLTFDKINNLTGTKGIIGTDLLGSSRVRDNMTVGKDLFVSGTTHVNGSMSINGNLSGTSVLNDNHMGTTSSTTIATSSSIKTYVDNITGATLPSTTHVITVENDIFKIDGADQATLTLLEGGTYIFDISDSSNAGHDFKLSLTSDGTHATDGEEYTEGVSSTGSAYSSGYSGSTASAGTADSNIKFIVPFGLYASTSSGTMYYYCENHSGIGGSITIVSASLDGTIKNYVDTKALLLSGGTMSGDISMSGGGGSHDITGVDNITMDGTLNMGGGSIESIANIDFTTGSITGMIDDDTMGTATSTKVASSESIKAYADIMLPLAGGTMTGALDMDDNDLQNVKRLSFEDGSFAVAMAKDEDDMASDSATSVASQQSIKAYVDAQTHAAALTQEQVEDYAGALVATGGTKTGITVTYQDGTGDMDFVVDDTGKLPLGGGTMIGDIVFPVTTSTPTSTPANGTMVISDVTSRGSHTYRINFYLNGGWRYEVLT